MDMKSAPSSAVPANADGAAAMMDIRHISEQQLAKLGVAEIAYLKPVVLNGMHGVAIHAADGTPMAVAGDRDVAVEVVVQNEMLPLSVH